MNFEFYQPNPRCRNTGDCAVRAISKALDMCWDDAYAALSVGGYQYKDWGNNNAVWGRLLLENGFQKDLISDSCLTGYTVEDFADEHPGGTYVLALPGHVVCVKDGTLYDSWDSSQEIVLYYFKKEDSTWPTRRTTSI